LPVRCDVDGEEYEQLEMAMEWLPGTSIKINIKIGGQRVKEGWN
jgi:hypothetical protein